jgi:hypothetical protein
MTMRLQWIGLTVLLFASQARADVSVCVTSTPLLIAEFAIAEGSGQPTTLRLEQAYYQLDGQTALDNTFSAPIHILGGYVPNTNCAQRSVDPFNTTIDFGTSTNLASIFQDAANQSALIEIDGLTLRNANGLWLSAGQYHQVGNDDSGSIRITRSVISTMHTKDVTLRVTSGGVTLENVQFDHIVNNFGNCAVDIALVGDSTLAAQNITADLGQSRDFCLTSDTQGTGHPNAYMYNSIVWGSDGGIPGIRGVNDDGHLFDIGLDHDQFHTFVGAGTPTILAQINADPKWTNAAAGDYHLLAASPAINSGTPTAYGGLPTTDIESQPRVIGSAPDRGAYESTFNGQYITVTNANDSGLGSLRQAIMDANTAKASRGIVFNIPGSCPHVITLTSKLDPIQYPLNIDGYSQPGSVPNDDPDAFNATLCVLLKSAGLGSAFRVSAGDSSGQLYLHGFGIGGFGQAVILLDGNNHRIVGNQFGGTVAAHDLPGAGLNAITIGVNATASLIVGGNAPADRNVIGGAGFNGVNIQSGVNSTPNHCQIVNNLIGLGPDGQTPIPNFYGIVLGGNGCLVLGNRIAGNTSDAIMIQGNGNVLQRNIIGVDVSGSSVANNGAGIRISTGNDNIVGTDAGSNLNGTLLANTIRFMTKGGVLLGASAGTGNSVRSNLVYDNGTVVFDSSVGDGFDLDLDADGPTANHGGSASGPNNLQNFPVVRKIYWNGYAAPAANSTDVAAIVSGQLDALPGAYKVDVYYSPHCDNGGVHVLGRGHAAAYLGNVSVTIPAGATGAAFSKPVTVPSNATNSVLSLTATDAGGSTSEIGSCAFLSNAVDDGIFRDGYGP